MGATTQDGVKQRQLCMILEVVIETSMEAKHMIKIIM